VWGWGRGLREGGGWQFLGWEIGHSGNEEIIGFGLNELEKPKCAKVLGGVCRLGSGMHPHLAHRTQLLLDATGQGLPVVEMFREARLPVNLVPITITGGQQVTINGSGRSVPKADLIGSLEVLLERGLLRIAADLPQADLLREELRRFERTSRRGGRLVYGPGESTGHDDSVMAVAMGGWWVWTNRRAALLGPELKPLG